MRVGIRREPGLVLLFSLVTLGIYGIWWLYEVSSETQDFLGEPDTSPGMEVTLSLLTFGIYVLFWDWKIAKKIARMQQIVGLPSSDYALLYLILNLSGFRIISIMMAQAHLNDVWRKAQANVYAASQQAALGNGPRNPW